MIYFAIFSCLGHLKQTAGMPFLEQEFNCDYKAK